MSTVTITKTKTEVKVKDLNKQFKDATSSNDLDTVLDNLKKVDYTCCFHKCKTKTKDFAIECKYCNSRFCTSHGLPEIHGCGEAVRRDEKQQFLHPHTKLGKEKHEKAQVKLNMKLKQMELERKAKVSSSKGKKK